jgi:hypothetical protein
MAPQETCPHLDALRSSFPTADLCQNSHARTMRARSGSVRSRYLVVSATILRDS